jgi:copper chaperone
MYTVKCNVAGIDGKNNKTQIKNALGKLNGVQEVGVNLTTGTVEIRYNEPATENQIKECIENTGYSIVYE